MANEEIPPELREEIANAEQEATEATGTPFVPHDLPPIAPPAAEYVPAPALPTHPQWLAQHHADLAPLPLEDLRERVRLLAEASVETYEDGGIKIRFDTENRRALLRPQAPGERW